MRVLLVSDSHGRNQNMEKVIRKASPVDLLIHLGDLEGSEGYLEETQTEHYHSPSLAMLPHTGTGYFRRY